MAVLANKPSFIVFIVSNSLAMVLSALVIFIYFWGKLLFLVSPDTDMIKNRKLLVMGVCCNLFAIPAMMMSFVTGTYTVLSHFPGLAIPVCILGCIYFVLSYLVIAKILQWWENDPEIAH
ncbi:hypothetical protein MKW92_024124 [Papaver armeniacum]|nr:hypothetical protein MKW92_024124 [Papaver armeniacum]